MKQIWLFKTRESDGLPLTFLENFQIFRPKILTYMTGTAFVKVMNVFELLFPTNETGLPGGKS